MVEQPRIVSKGGLARGILPVYSLDQFLFMVALMTGAFGLLSLTGVDAAGLMTLSGGLGAFAVNYMTRPAYLLIDRSQMERVEETLRSIEYRYVPELDHWVPPIPRWLRWSYNFVRVEDAQTEARIYGPANALRFIAGEL